MSGAMRRGMAAVGLVLGLAVGLVAQELPVRTWTDTQGRKAELSFQGFQDGKLRMRRPDGKEFTLPLTQFSTADQKYLLDSQVERAIMLKGQGQAMEAVALLQTLAQLNSQQANVQLWLGRTHMELNDWAAAAEAYRAYAALAPSDVEGPRGAARAYDKQGNQDLAEFWYQKALEVDPASPALKAEVASFRGEPLAVPPADAENPFLSSTPPTTTVATPPAGTPTAATTPASATTTMATTVTTATPTTPVSTTPVSTAPAAESEAKGFWRQGLVGILGGRTVWWGRLIAIVLFSFGILGGIIQMGAMYKQMARSGMVQSKEQAGCGAFFGSVIGFSFSYILYWGIPEGWAWGIMIPVVLVGSIMGAGAAASD